MNRYAYPNLTVVEQDSSIRFRIQQLRTAVVAKFPQQMPHTITPQTIQAAIHMQFQAFVYLHDISQYTAGFLLDVRSASLRNRMLTAGFLTMSPFSLNLVPWNPEDGSVTVVAYPHLISLSNFDHNSYAKNSGRPLRRIRLQIAGIPPHLCSRSTLSALLHKVGTIYDIVLDSSIHKYQLHVDTHCPDAIPQTANIAVQKIEEGKLLFNIWPIWYDSVHATPQDALSFIHADQQDHGASGNFVHSLHARYSSTKHLLISSDKINRRGQQLRRRRTQLCCATTWR